MSNRVFIGLQPSSGGIPGICHALASRRKSVRAKVTALFLFLVSLTGAANAQDYQLQAGRPTFTTAWPVGLGFVNVSNGNLHLEIPLGAFPQRGGHTFAARLIYDGRIWHQVFNGTSTVWQPTNVANSQGGWRFVTSADVGSVAFWVSAENCDPGPGNIDTYGGFTWTASDGTLHEFNIGTQAVSGTRRACGASSVSSGSSYAIDSTGFYMSVTNYTEATVYAPDGTQVYPSVEDTNGNYFSTDSNGNVIDTLGRTAVTKTVNGNQTTYAVLNSQGGRSNYVVTTETVNVNTNFGVSQVTEYSGTITAIQSVQLPDITTYQFSYDSGTSAGHYGELTGATLPTQGQISYGYSNFLDANGRTNRWVSSYGAGSGTWNFAAQVLTTCPSGFSTCQQVTATKPSSDNVVFTFGLNNGAWVSQAQYYSGSVAPSNLLETVSQTWNTSNACPLSGCTGSAYIQSVSTTTALTVPGGGSIISTVKNTYDSIYDMNVTQVSEWKYYTGSLPSTPDRITSVAYLANPGHNIINRPTSITIQNGSQTQTFAQTKITYDSYGSGLVSVTGATHHDDTNYGTGYTARGNPTQIQRLVSGSTYLTTSMTYDITGQVRSSSDPASNTTSMSYSDNFYNDNGSNPPSTYSPGAPTNAYLTQVTLPLTGSTSSGYYFGSGKLALSTDQNSTTTYQHYLDSLDRPTHGYLPLGWVLQSYSSTDTQIDTYTGITDASPSTGCSSCRHDRVNLDNLGRPIQGQLYNDPDGATIVATSYDANSRVATVTNPYRGSSNGQDTFTYDGLDRTVRVQHSTDSNAANSYYGAAVSGNGGISSQLCSSSTYGLGYPALVLDEAGKKRQVWTDGFGKMIEADEPDNNGSLTVGTCYTYDLLGNLAQTSQGSQTRTYTYL